MHAAYAVERSAGCDTLAIAVLLGPVLKNRQNTAGKVTNQHPRNNGKPISIAIPDTSRYEPPNRERSLSPTHPPASVAPSPAAAVIPPISTPTGMLHPSSDAALIPRYSSMYVGIQNDTPPMAN